MVNGGEKNLDQETGWEKEAEDGGSAAGENTFKTEQGQSVNESLVEGVAVLSANGHDVKPAEQNQLKEREGTASDAEVMRVNGVSEVRATGEETETSAVNAEVKTQPDNSESKSDEVNGALDTATSPSVLKTKGTWADVVSNGSLANGTRDKHQAVSSVADDSTANGVAEE